MVLMAYSLAGKMWASLETRTYEFPPLYYIYGEQKVVAYGARVNLGYHLGEGLGLYLALGMGYSKDHPTFISWYEGGYYTEYERIDFVYTYFPVEAGLGVSFVPFRGEKALLRIGPEFRFVYLNSKMNLKDSTWTHYTDIDTTTVSVSDTTYFIKANAIAVPLRISGEYFITDNVSLGLDYGIYFLSLSHSSITLEGSSDTTLNSSLGIFRLAERLNFKATFYF